MRHKWGKHTTAYMSKSMSEDPCMTCTYKMEFESEDVGNSCASSDYEESNSSHIQVVQPFMYEPEASESSDNSCSGGAGESSSSSDESSSKIGNTDW